MEDGSTRSELTIRSLDKNDVGRGIVTARNIHGQISAQFSILLCPNEEPVTTTDFRAQLKNKVETKALTAEDLNSHTVQQFDFRSNLKRSKTNENLSDLKFENSDSEKELIDPELDAKLKNIRQKIEPPSLEEASVETDSVFTTVTSVPDEIPENNTTLDLIGDFQSMKINESNQLVEPESQSNSTIR